jgi:hypothetical protein
MFGATCDVGMDEKRHTILGGVVHIEIVPATKIVSAFRTSCK